MNVKELRAICKHLKIRGYSRWSKAEMEVAIAIKSVSNWYDDIMPNCSIEIKNEDLEDAELNIQHL